MKGGRQRTRSKSVDLDEKEADEYLKNVKCLRKLPPIKETDEDSKENPLKQIASSTGTESTASMNSSSTGETTTEPLTLPKTTDPWDGWEFSS